MKKETMQRLNGIRQSIVKPKQVVQKTDESLDIFLYGDIYSCWWDEDANDSKKIKNAIEANPDAKEINVYINSCGGDVFEGVAMYQQLKRASAKVNVFIDGSACSVASIIAMAGDTITMYPGTMMMIHNCWTYAYGNANELRKIADDLDKIMESNRDVYLSKAGDKLTEEKLIELLDGETWLTPQDCVDYGLCDVIEENQTKNDESENGTTEQKNEYQRFSELMEQYHREHQSQQKNETKESQPKAKEETGWFF